MKARAVAWTARNKERVRHFVAAYKGFFGCTKCGNQDWRVLDFHHLGNKELNIADAIAHGWAIARVLKEIVKCSVLCANCHRIETRYCGVG